MRIPIAIILFATLIWGQEPPPLHVNVNLVNVDFAVRDTQGGLATNLARDDFEILEDGVPQKIEFFSHNADVPLTLGLIADFSGSQVHFLKRHHKDLETFLREVLGPRDRAFLICFGNHLRMASDLTPSSSDLMAALESVEHDTAISRNWVPRVKIGSWARRSTTPSITPSRRNLRPRSLGRRP